MRPKDCSQPRGRPHRLAQMLRGHQYLASAKLCCLRPSASCGPLSNPPQGQVRTRERQRAVVTMGMYCLTRLPPAGHLLPASQRRVRGHHCILLSRSTAEQCWLASVELPIQQETKTPHVKFLKKELCTVYPGWTTHMYPLSACLHR